MCVSIVFLKTSHQKPQLQKNASLEKGSQKKSWATSFATAVGKPTGLKSFPIPSHHHIEIFHEDEV